MKATYSVVPYEIGQRVVAVELVVEHGPVGGGLDSLSTSPQHHGPVAELLARLPTARALRPVLHGQRGVVLERTHAHHSYYALLHTMFEI